MTSPDPVRVRAGELRAARSFQLDQAARVSQLACEIRSAATVGNAFGKIGKVAGLEDSYRGWVDGEARALEDVTRMLGELGDALAMTADDYDGTDTAAADRVRSAYRSPR